MRPVLVIMAAGMGSRYGGLKQMDPIDEQGNLIIDFSIFDALKAGFKKIIFIIKKEIADDFKERIGNRISEHMEVDYVFQELDDLPKGYQMPKDRTKPWGTGHAVLGCIDKIDGPFAVINADDYYGKQAFQMIFENLVSASDDSYKYTMVGYKLENTLTENGHVARGVCQVTEEGMLTNIRERTHIEKRSHKAVYTEDDGKTWVTIPLDSTVSMNIWGFNKSVLQELRVRFIEFLDNEAFRDPLKAEYFLPNVIGALIEENKATVKVLKSTDKWYGVTYREDKAAVMKAINEFKEKGIYPQQLWKEKG